ncbi:MAG: RluA family pseudouridine synthase [Deltaproteobacteria bacterium]|nr:RluA family pseudouridine synthase [Deltaproteobacteria bacterium]
MSSYLRVREKTRETDRRPTPSDSTSDSPRGGDPRSVPEGLGGSALDAVVRGLFELPWNRARDLVRRGKVLVDGKTVNDPVRRVPAGAKVVIDLAARNARTVATDLPEGAIVHVDPHVVVVEKPAGISTVPFDPEGMGASIARRSRGPAEEVTLDERVRVALARRERWSGPPPELGVVHRLDKETSGLLVFTRTWAAKKTLMQAFRVHAIERRYLAIVNGDVKAKTIRTHFVENRGDGLRGSIEHRGGRKHAVGSEKGQLAVTHVEVVERLAKGRATLVACRLETGRTHQIRIHLSEEGHPVAGERVYSRGRDPSALVKAPRLMLHAAELGFVHPATGKEMRWTSELPGDMQRVLASLR